MSSDSKRYKGQLQVYAGSVVGEPITTNLIDYNAAGQPSYVGEAKVGTKPDEARWYIQRLVYDSSCNLVATLSATNSYVVAASSVTLSVSNGMVTLALGDADLDLISKGDKVWFSSGTNTIGAEPVLALTADSIIVAANGSEVPEALPSGSFSLTVTLESEASKPFDKRRWDKRANYLYG